MDKVSDNQGPLSPLGDFCLIVNIPFFSSFLWAMQANDSGLASYVAGQIDRSLSWKVCQMGPSS